jgi:hypothetical protein
MLFSGKTPVPSGEANFKTWRRQVYQLQKDDTDDDDNDALPDHQLKRLLLQSLQPPALDTVWNMDVNSEQILEVLDNLYGSVVDGQDLLLQLQTTYQAEKETSSEYIQRLYLLATDVAEIHGIRLADIPYHLLRQVIRGGRDESLIQKLNLEDTLSDPPTFAELLLLTRKEEETPVASLWPYSCYHGSWSNYERSFC